MNNDGFHVKGYLIAAGLGAVAAMVMVFLLVRAMLRMMSGMMPGMMQGMMESGGGPPDI